MNAQSEIVFGAEFISDSIDEALPLMREHWDGLDHFGDDEFDPDITAYKKLDDACLLRVFTARENGSLIGYCVFFVKYSFISKKLLEADQLGLFIKKDSRGFGVKFIKWCDECLKNEGVNVVYQNIPSTTRLGSIFKRIGYKEADHSYARRIN